MRIGLISELVDEISLEKPLSWESINYESAKEVAILNAIEQFNDIKNNHEMSEDDKETSYVAIMAYMMMENMMQWIDLCKLKESR